MISIEIDHQTDIYICFVYNSPKYSTFTKRQSNLPSALEMIEDDITKYSTITMGNTVLLGDFNAHTSTSDLDFVSGDYGKGMEDIIKTYQLLTESIHSKELSI